MYKTFSAPKKGVANIHKVGNESVVTASYKIKFIDSARFMASSLTKILLMISQEGFIKFNVKIAIVFLNMKVSKTIR